MSRKRLLPSQFRSRWCVVPVLGFVGDNGVITIQVGEDEQYRLLFLAGDTGEGFPAAHAHDLGKDVFDSLLAAVDAAEELAERVGLVSPRWLTTSAFLLTGRDAARGLRWHITAASFPSGWVTHVVVTGIDAEGEAALDQHEHAKLPPFEGTRKELFAACEAWRPGTVEWCTCEAVVVPDLAAP